jgi:hypothetical protein
MNTFHSADNLLKVLEFVLLILLPRLSPDSQLLPFLVRLFFQVLELLAHYNPPTT